MDWDAFTVIFHSPKEIPKKLTTFAQKGQKTLSSRAARMTKYRRKTANAKERDRMKQLNVAFDRLRGVMPDVKTITKEEKDTKVKNPLLNIIRYQKTFMFCKFQICRTWTFGKKNCRHHIDSGDNIASSHQLHLWTAVLACGL